MTREAMLEIMRKRQDNQKRFNSATTQHTIETMSTKTTANDTKEEENTMKETTTISINETTYFEKNNRYYAIKADGKTTRIGKAEYEAAQQTKADADEKIGLGDDEHEGLFDDLRTPEQEEAAMKEAEEWLAREDAKRGRKTTEEEQADAEWQAKADAEIEARADKEAEDAKATEDAFNGKTKAEKKDQPKAKKPRKSKDIAFEDEEHKVTLTAKQVDFILHLSDSDFWTEGLDSSLWCDVLCDEIKGQFEGKPMTIGAMISTLCEKGLATRTKEKRENRKTTTFQLTIKGKLIAAKVGLK